MMVGMNCQFALEIKGVVYPMVIYAPAVFTSITFTPLGKRMFLTRGY